MKAFPTCLSGVAIFGICALAAWSLRGGDEARAGSTAAGGHADDRKASKTSRSTGKTGVPVEVTQRLTAIRAGRTPEERLRATIALAESLPVADMERWFKEDWFDGREDMQNYLFYRIARARWLAADPEGLMSYCLREKSERSSEVAGAWVKRDPDAALAFAHQLNNPAQRGNFLSQIGAALGKADPALALDTIGKFAASLDANGTRSLLELVRGVSHSAPDLLKSRIGELPLSLQNEARSYLTTALLKRNFASAVAELEESPDGKRSFVTAMRDPDLIKQAAKDPGSLPKGWFAEAAGNAGYYLVREDPQRWLDEDLAALDFSPRQVRNLRQYALNQLAQTKPEQIIAMLAGQGLREEERSSAIGTVVSSMAKDREKAETWIATLTSEQDIAAAKSALSSYAQNDFNQITPASFIASLAGNDATTSWTQVRMAANWGNEERAQVMKEFAALPAAEKEGVAKKISESHYENFPPAISAEAVRYLIENKKADPELEKRGIPNDSSSLVQAAATLGSRWAEENPETGSRWIDSLPAGPERLWAAKNFASRWAVYEPAEAKKWIATLPAEERTQVQQFIDSGETSR